MRIARIAIVALAPFALLACSEEPEELEAVEEEAPKPVRTPPPTTFSDEGSSDGGFADDVEGLSDDEQEAADAEGVYIDDEDYDSEGEL